MILQFIIFSFYIVVNQNVGISDIMIFVKNGGRGPGSYYFWIYLQVAFLLPSLWGGHILKASKTIQLIFFLTLSIGLEVLFSLINLPEWIYRLLATRYIFLFYFAYNWWVCDGIIINMKCLFLSFLSIATVLFLSFTDINLEPLLFYTNWKTHRWICYYYVASLMVYLLWLFYKKVRKKEWIDSKIRTIGKCSYEIYLVQMLVFVFFDVCLNPINNQLLRILLYMILTTLFSFILGIGCKYFIVDKCKFLKV